MKIELFEFEVKRLDGTSFTDEEIDRLMTQFLEPRGLLWGGGGGPDHVQGVVSTERNIDLKVVLNEFAGFLRDTDAIVIRLITEPNNLGGLERLEKLENVSFEPYTE